MKKFEVPAIVFGGGMNGLGVVRSLGRKGVPVYCVVERNDPVIHSRFCKKYYIIPNIQENKSILRRFLVKIERLNDCAVLFPTSDVYSLHLSEVKEEMEGNYHLPLPSHEIVRKLVDKKEFYKFLCEFGVPHPLTFFPESPEDTRRISKEIKYPVFIKPSMSQEFSRKFHRKGFVASSANELMRHYLLALNHKIEVIFQEVIPGLAAKNIYGLEGYFDKNSNPKAFFAYCRLRGWPPVFGNTCMRESISISDVNASYLITKSCLQHLKYHGLMEAEWKRDPRDGVFKLLEINARQSMQISLSTRCGVNLVLITYLDAIGEKIRRVDNYEKGIKWMSFLEDLRSVIETDTSIKDWIFSLKTVKEWSFFAMDDFSPWIMSNFETARAIIQEFFALWKSFSKSANNLLS